MSSDGSLSLAPRRPSVAVSVGGVIVGGGAPVVVQSMTNTDTADIKGTIEHVAALARAGSEIVRITVDRDEAAKAVPHIRDQLRAKGVTILMVEQNARSALAMSDYGLVLVQGQTTMERPAADLLADPAVGQMFLGIKH